MFIVAGLGNPDKEYQSTRHNVGFMAADEIARRYSFADFKTKFQALLAEGSIDGEKVLLVKPLTYMNLSGNAVGAIAAFYKVPPAHVIVIHDDMDLPVGTIKGKFGGGAGGHNGLKSIDSQLGNAYGRVRIGVGRPAEKSQVVDWVLSTFNKADKEKIDAAITLVADTIGTFIQKDCGAFGSAVSEKLRK